MRQRKSYGQFCALARSLDRIGDRWTLLVIRELLLGPRTFRQLQRALGGMSPSLLSERLSDLSREGLVERNDAPPRSRAVEYRLTEAGSELDEAVSALIRWGTRWMMSGPGDDDVDPGWAALALKALLHGSKVARRGVVHLDIDGTWVTVRTTRGGTRRVDFGRHARPDAVVSCSFGTALGTAAGFDDLDAARTEVTGDFDVAGALLSPARS